ncbi:hypothetical protein FKM82_031027 [Ascaphus truei]
MTASATSKDVVISLGRYVVLFSACSGVQVSTYQHFTQGLKGDCLCLEGLEDVWIVVWGVGGGMYAAQRYVSYSWVNMEPFICSHMWVSPLFIGFIWLFSSSLYHIMSPPE